MSHNLQPLMQVLHALPCQWLLIDYSGVNLKVVDYSKILDHPQNLWESLEGQQNPFELCQQSYPELYENLVSGLRNSHGGNLLSIPMEIGTDIHWPLLFVEKINITHLPIGLVIFTDTQNKTALYHYQDALNYASNTVTTLNQLLHLHSRTLGGTPINSNQTGDSASGLNILFIEDTPINQKITSHYLGQYGHSITIAPNGIEALKLYPSQHFDVILTDVDMPEMDGYDTTKAIRQLEQDNNLDPAPIIVLTSRDLLESGKALKQAGASAFIPKPIEHSLFLEILRTLKSSPQQSEFYSYVF